MGTRRSRHNKGRKPDGLHDLAQVNCSICFKPFFIQRHRANSRRLREALCEGCRAGIPPSIVPLPVTPIELPRPQPSIKPAQPPAISTGQVADIDGYQFGRKDMEVINALQAGPAFLDRSLVSAIVRLKKQGLVERVLVNTMWGLTERGRAVRLTVAVVRSRWPSYTVMMYSPKNAEEIIRLKTSALAALQTGFFNGQPIDKAARDFLSVKRGRAVSAVVIWFLYQIDMPLRDIAWALRPELPLITSQSVTCMRRQLGIPRRTKVGGASINESLADEITTLLNEGSSIEEICAYYELPRTRIEVLNTLR